MKANGAKRKIFNDAIDLLDQMEEAAAVSEMRSGCCRRRVSVRFMIILFGCMKESGWKTWSRASGSMVS